MQKKVVPIKPETLTIAMCERALGEKAEKWEGRCYEIACRILDAKLTRGTAVYGHWLGPVHEKSSFRRGIAAMPFVQHGWIVLPGETRVLDPTRWAFECKKPYLFLGEPGKLYDEGGNEFRGVMSGSAPSYDSSEKSFEVTERVMDSETWSFVERLLEIDVAEQEPGVLSRGQLFWLANAPLKVLGRHAKGVYAALVKLDQDALIPIDNRRRVEAGRWP